MNTQPVVHSRSLSNGFGRQRGEREGGTRSENKSQSGKANNSKTSSKIGIYESPSRDRLVFLTTCLIGHHVEVQVKNGSIYTGIFHSTNADKYFERELEPWIPDEDDPRCPELENIFDGHRNRLLYRNGINLKQTKHYFDEELYTTKLEKGPKMRELEREALRVAREIEGEDTLDQRGIQLYENFDIDEETKYSSVYRDEVVDDSGYDEDEDILLDSVNTETFGGSPGSMRMSSIDWTNGKGNNGVQDYTHYSESNVDSELYRSGSYDHAWQLASEPPNKSFASTAGESRISSEHGDTDAATESIERHMLAGDGQTSKPEYSEKTQDAGVLSSNATSNPSPPYSLKGQEKTSSSGLESSVAGKAHVQTHKVNTHGRPGCSASSNSDRGGAVSSSGARGLSPSSSLGSLSSEKSTLNPNAKEFKFNPHAKSFVPSKSPVRSPSPVSDGSFYYPTNLPIVPQIPGMPVGIGGHSFGHQPVMFNPQVGQMQTPQAYYHPNGSQYGQQMLPGHPRQVVYMPNYQAEMQYNGRDY